MPILTQCPHCQKKFRAADKIAGKSVKCPGCQGVVRVPAAQGEQETPSSPDSTWQILTENGEKLGPVSKEQLDNLATKGRLSFCQVRRSDWKAWKWADDVYPELPPSKRKASTDSPSSSEEPDSARLVICPDCGNTVSRRATQCPHCGCPAAILMKQTSPIKDGPVATQPPPPVPQAAKEAALNAAVDAVGSEKHGSWAKVAIIGAVLLLVLTGATLYVGWRFYSATQQVAEVLGVPTEEPEPPPPVPEPEEPSEELLSHEGKTECIDEAAREMAKFIDDVQRENHMPLSAISQAMENAEMLKALAGVGAGNGLDAIPDSIPGGGGPEPYQSQVNKLFIECRDWVRENVKRGACTSKDVWDTAQQWASDKRAEVLKPLGGLSTQGFIPQVELPEAP